MVGDDASGEPVMFADRDGTLELSAAGGSCLKVHASPLRQLLLAQNLHGTVRIFDFGTGLGSKWLLILLGRANLQTVNVLHQLFIIIRRCMVPDIYRKEEILFDMMKLYWIAMVRTLG